MRWRGAGWILLSFGLAGCFPPDDPVSLPPGTGASGGTGGTTGGTGGTTGGTGGATGGTGGSASGTGGSASGAGGSASGAGGSAGSAGSKGALSGQIQFGTLHGYPAAGQAYSFANAWFRRAAPSSTGCSSTTYGACTVTTCTSVEPDPEPSPAPTAGTITIRTDAEFSVDLVPDGIGVYVQDSLNGHLLGGEQVTLTAEGADVPAFTYSQTYPLVLLLTEPALDPAESIITVPRDQDFVLGWERGVPGLRLNVQPAQSSASTRLFCAADSEAGTVRLEAAALSAMPSGTRLLLLGVSGETVKAGDSDVSITSASGVMNPDRSQRMELLLE